MQCVVAIRGVEVTTASFRELQRRVHVEIEESVLISCSIADNVRFARPEALVDEVGWACRFAGLEEFISSLPEGFNTEVWEGAIRLSGRQPHGLTRLRPRKWCSEPSRLGPVGRCLWSGGHRVIFLENASSLRSHHDGHHLLLWTSSPSCQSTWPRLTRISCARCSAPSSRRSWVPRSMRSAARPTTLRAPSAPIGATGLGNGPGIHGWARSTLASASLRQGTYFPDWLQERSRLLAR